MNTKKLILLAILTTIALTIFYIEMLLPPLVAIPGVKLGLANIVSLFAMFWIGRKEAFLILISRILLGSIFAGQMMTLLYSLSGGILAFVVIACLYRYFSLEALWIPSILGGILHNIGQILCAMLILQTPQILAYLPILLLSGIVAGAFTGLAAQYLINHQAFKNISPDA